MAGIKKYDDSLREAAVALYIASGSEKFVGDSLSVSRELIKEWRKSQWWKEEMRTQIIERDFLLQNKFTKVIEKAAEIVQDRMDNGDVRILKDGTEKRTPIKAHDAALIAAIFHDKRRDARNNDVQLESAVNVNHLLTTLSEKFADFGKQVKKPNIIDVVPEEVLENSVVEIVHSQLQTGVENGRQASQEA